MENSANWEDCRDTSISFIVESSTGWLVVGNAAIDDCGAQQGCEVLIPKKHLQELMEVAPASCGPLPGCRALDCVYGSDQGKAVCLLPLLGPG